MSMLMLEAVLLLALIAITLVVIFNKDLMVVVVTYCAFSFITMFLYIVMGAPDVAFTEAVIGVISTIYFIMTLRNIDRGASDAESATIDINCDLPGCIFCDIGFPAGNRRSVLQAEYPYDGLLH